MPDGTPQRDDGQPAAPKPRASWYAQGLSDSVGDRLLMFDNSDRPSLELLRFRPDFAAVPAFERALRERVQRLSQFRHPAFARVRSVQRLEPDNDLALVSHSTPGKRLSEILPQVRGAAFAATVVRQLGPALAELQRQDAGMSHGVLNPDRIVVSPDGQLTIIEHVIGPAIDALDLRGSELATIGAPLPPTADGALQRLDAGTDWYQLGVIAVSVLLGRALTTSELPEIATLLDRLEASARADGAPIPPALRHWLDRALQLSGPRIGSGVEGQAALEELVRKALPTPVQRLDEAVSQPPLIAVRPTPAATAPRRVAPRPVAQPEAVPAQAQPADPATIPVNRPAASQPSPRLAVGAVATADAPVASRTLFGQTSAAAGAVPAAVDRRAERRARERPAPSLPPARRRPVTTLAAALGLVAAVEAGIIVGLARVVWFAPSPPIVVEADSSTDAVVVGNPDAASAALGVAVAPDLRWVRVTTSLSKATGRQPRTTAGTVEIVSPIELKVFEQSRQVGSVPGPGFELAPGRHDLTLINRALGYSERQVLEVEPGQAVSIHVTPLRGWVTIDAAPWADVAIDGEIVGRTPLTAVPVAPGEHEVTFRNPGAGADRQRVTVKSDAITRVTGNLRR